MPLATPLAVMASSTDWQLNPFLKADRYGLKMFSKCLLSCSSSVRSNNLDMIGSIHTNRSIVLYIERVLFLKNGGNPCLFQCIWEFLVYDHPVNQINCWFEYYLARQH